MSKHSDSVGNSAFLSHSSPQSLKATSFDLPNISRSSTCQKLLQSRKWVLAVVQYQILLVILFVHHLVDNKHGQY